MREEPSLGTVDFAVGYPKTNGFVGLGGEKEVLIACVGGLLSLFENRHEPVSRLITGRDFGVRHLEQE